jgi:hypothetical protein
LSINPDLTFGQLAVGDVKYREAGSKWQRSDIYQLTTFATGYKVGAAGLFTFSTVKTDVPPEVPVGPVKLNAFVWDAAPETDPDTSASTIVAETAEWIASLESTTPCYRSPAQC